MIRTLHMLRDDARLPASTGAHPGDVIVRATMNADGETVACYQRVAEFDGYLTRDDKLAILNALNLGTASQGEDAAKGPHTDAAVPTSEGAAR